MDRTGMTGVSTFTDRHLADELDFAYAERAAGGCLGQRLRVARRIEALEAEREIRKLERLWAAS